MIRVSEARKAGDGLELAVVHLAEKGGCYVGSRHLLWFEMISGLILVSPNRTYRHISVQASL